MTSMRTICFDLDGTLTDPKPGITRSIQHALRGLDRPVPAEDELTWCIGPPLIRSLEKLTGDRATAERALVLYRERFGAVGLYENRVYDGIPDVLAGLAGAGHRLFVATSKPRVYAERIIEHFGLGAHFTTVHGSELDGTRVEKTDLLAWIVERERLDPQATIMIGDRSHDIVGARRNAMTALGVLYGYGSRAELEAAGAHGLCASPHALTADLARVM